MDENTKKLQKEIAKNKIQVILSSIAVAVLIVMELYVMINLKNNFMFMAVGILLMIVALFFLISAVLDISMKTKDMEEQKYEEIYNAQKASYLVIRKSFDELDQRLKNIEESSSLPAEDIINAQKAVAKVTISRSKENTDALMNSNDELINQLFSIKEKIDANNNQIIEKQQALIKESNFDLQQKIAELTSQISNIEGRIQNGIPVIAQPMQMAPPVYEAPPVVPAVEPVMDAAAPDPVQVVEEVPVDIPDIPAEPEPMSEPVSEALPEEPIIEEPAAEVTEDIGLDIDVPTAEEVTEDVGIDLEVPETEAVTEDIGIDLEMPAEEIAEEPVVEESIEIPSEEPVAEELIDIPTGEPSAEEELIEIPSGEPVLEESLEIPTEEPVVEEIIQEAPASEEEIVIPTEEASAEEEIIIPNEEPEEIVLENTPPSDPGAGLDALLEEIGEDELQEVAEEEESAEPEAEEPASDEIVIPDVGVDLTDPNRVMSAEEIEKLFASI